MSLQWYARYVGDYLRDTAHLTLLEHGAYTLLMDYYYSTGEPLPANADANAPALALATNERLYRICRAVTKAEQEAVDSVLSYFFELDDGNYHHRRIDRELEKRSDISEKRSAANAKMREARKNKKKQASKQSASANASADASASTKDQQMHSTTTTTTTIKVNNPPTPLIDVPDFIDGEIWTEWIEHRKQKKCKLTPLQAKKQINKLTQWNEKGHNPNEIIERSIRNGWQGLFEPDSGGSGQPRAGTAEYNARRLQDWMDE